jgi:hypothetical protein
VYAAPSTPPPPPPPARVEGRVVARDGTPRRDVEVRATLPDTARQYTTFTDGEGRFRIAGFDAEVDVEVGFWAPTPRMGARCVFRLTRRAPEKKLVVVLDHLDPRLTAPEGDCERWEGGPVKFLSRDEERAIFGAREAPRPVSLDLRARDIAGVTWSRDGADVRMNEAASREFYAFMAANAGRPAVMTIDGMLAWSARIPGPWRDLPDRPETRATMFIFKDQLRGALCRMLEDAAARSRREP